MITLCLNIYARVCKNTALLYIYIKGCPRGVLVKAMDYGIVRELYHEVSEFVLQSRYYVHFRANTLGKGMNPLISLQLWVNSRAD